MASKLSDPERAAIAEGLRAGKSANQVARESGRGLATVLRIASDEAIDLDRSATKKATEASVADSRARLVALAPRLLESAERLADQLFAPHVAFAFGGRDNVYSEHEIPEPTARDKQALMVSIGIAVQRAAEIVGLGSDSIEVSDLEEWLMSRRGKARRAVDVEAD